MTAQRLPGLLWAWSVVGRDMPYETKRNVAAALSRRLLDPQRLYRAPGGWLFSVDPADPFQALMITGLYDRHLMRIACHHARSGSVVIDGGAQLGYMTLRLARAVGSSGEVHAFEPDPRAVPRLREHVASNGLSWVTVNERGLLDRNDTIEMALPAVLGWASVIPDAWDAQQTALVQMTTLDRYLADHRIDPGRISLIKLDLEGAELDALQGARETLAETRAAVIVECLPDRMRYRGQDPDELFDLMREAGYGEPQHIAQEDLLFAKD